jgi:hypothetical protein
LYLQIEAYRHRERIDDRRLDPADRGDRPRRRIAELL